MHSERSSIIGHLKSSDRIDFMFLSAETDITQLICENRFSGLRGLANSTFFGLSENRPYIKKHCKCHFFVMNWLLYHMHQGMEYGFSKPTAVYERADSCERDLYRECLPISEGPRPWKIKTLDSRPKRLIPRFSNWEKSCSYRYTISEKHNWQNATEETNNITHIRLRNNIHTSHSSVEKKQWSWSPLKHHDYTKHTNWERLRRFKPGLNILKQRPRKLLMRKLNQAVLESNESFDIFDFWQI